MHRISGLQLVVVAALFFFSFFAVPGTVSASIKVAIIPYINSSAEERSVVGETINKKLDDYFQKNARYSIVPPELVNLVLARHGYDAAQMILPEKEFMMTLANDLDADAVLALDFTRIQAYRRYTIITSTTIGSVSVYAKALSVYDSHFVSLRVEKQARLTTYSIGPGFREKEAIAASIEQAMDELFRRLPF
ncbi:hypothetical protein [Acetonema longum]|uniref:Lipoprotein n=1 Tax=Acetonema longum DSM 6540 TaxID=1009370 RepID=F7NJ58_9FIRM|nr:hypothetical protein [Acetonema longum]EGO63948.1 hypothetical protein ALO_10569 [Acetonema longum DSM 6540]